VAVSFICANWSMNIFWYILCHILKACAFSILFLADISLFCVPVGFLPKMKNWVYRHSTGFLNYASVLTNSVTLL
jgi:hypothetical protein